MQLYGSATVNQWSIPLRHGDIGIFLYMSILSILHGLLLLFSFCCSSTIASNSKSVLFAGLDVLSTGSSPSEGLVLLVGEISRPFTSGFSCGAGVTKRKKKGKTVFSDVQKMFSECWIMLHSSYLGEKT